MRFVVLSATLLLISCSSLRYSFQARQKLDFFARNPEVLMTRTLLARHLWASTDPEENFRLCVQRLERSDLTGRIRRVDGLLYNLAVFPRRVRLRFFARLELSLRKQKDRVGSLLVLSGYYSSLKLHARAREIRRFALNAGRHRALSYYFSSFSRVCYRGRDIIREHFAEQALFDLASTVMSLPQRIQPRTRIRCALFYASRIKSRQRHLKILQAAVALAHRAIKKQHHRLNTLLILAREYARLKNFAAVEKIYRATSRDLKSSPPRIADISIAALLGDRNLAMERLRALASAVRRSEQTRTFAPDKAMTELAVGFARAGDLERSFQHMDIAISRTDKYGTLPQLYYLRNLTFSVLSSRNSPLIRHSLGSILAKGHRLRSGLYTAQFHINILRHIRSMRTEILQDDYSKILDSVLKIENDTYQSHALRAFACTVWKRRVPGGLFRNRFHKAAASYGHSVHRFKIMQIIDRLYPDQDIWKKGARLLRLIRASERSYQSWDLYSKHGLAIVALLARFGQTSMAYKIAGHPVFTPARQRWQGPAIIPLRAEAYATIIFRGDRKSSDRRTCTHYPKIL